MKNAQPLSAAELRKQIATLNGQRDVISQRLAAICAERMKLGSVAVPALVDEDERAARSHALSLLNGIASEISLPPEVTEERALYRERRGIDLALKILQEKLAEANAAATQKWWKTVAPEWQKLVHEAVIAKVRLAELDRRTEALLTGVDIFALPSIPLGQFRGAIGETPLREVVTAAIDEGIISKAEMQEIEIAK